MGYSAITAGEIDQDSPITTGLMTKLRDNPEAIATGDLGATRIVTAALTDGLVTTAKLDDASVTAAKMAANAIVDANVASGANIDGSKLAAGSVTILQMGVDSVGASEIIANGVGQSEIASGAVHQAELDTSTGIVSKTGGEQTFTLPGGEYGFYPQIQVSDDNPTFDDYLAYLFKPNSIAERPTAYTTKITLIAPTGDTLYARQRYINSSPPFDIGDGEIPFFIYLSLNGNNVDSTYAADVPPWAYNGPTRITGKLTKKLNKETGNFEYKKIQKRKRFNRKSRKVISEEIEVGNDIKNADMDLIPHPFSGTAGKKIIILDPCSTLELKELHECGENVAELIIENYISFDNVELKRKAPNGVMPVAWKWKRSF